MTTSTQTVVAIPGDGIGREVMPPALQLLALVAPDLAIDEREAGFELWKRTGDAIPPSVLRAARESAGVLFGCTGTPSPPPPGYRSPILVLRKALDLRFNLRYCRGPGGMDLLMVRDTSEGLYAGAERAIPGGASADYVVTEAATDRLAEVAARFARARSGRVTIVHKANVLALTDGLFRRRCIDTLEAAGIAWDEALADAAGYHLVLDPARFDVMVMTGHVGDLLSDVAAAVAGGLGRVPSLSLSGSGAPPLAEPIHGSAPDLVGTGRADPVAMILSAALLLGELGRGDAQRRVEDAVAAHLKERRHGDKPGTRDITADIASRIGTTPP